MDVRKKDTVYGCSISCEQTDLIQRIKQFSEFQFKLNALCARVHNRKRVGVSCSVTFFSSIPELTSRCIVNLTILNMTNYFQLFCWFFTNESIEFRIFSKFSSSFFPYVLHFAKGASIQPHVLTLFLFFSCKWDKNISIYRIMSK